MVFLFLTFQLDAQKASFRVYSVEDGLAQSQVYAITQDHKGYLWIGTRGGGLSRFDGTTFQTFSEKDGLVNSYVSSLVQDRKKMLWIGTNDGLSYFDGIKFRTIQHPKLFNAFAIHDISIRANGEVWVATNYGLYRVEGRKLVEMNGRYGLKPKSVNTLLFDEKDQLWFGTGAGLFSINLHTAKTTSWGLKSKVMRNSITCLSLDKNGDLWFGTYGDGAYCKQGDKAFRVDLKHELYTETVFDIFFDQKGVGWLATLRKGVIQYDPSTKKFATFNEKNGIGNNHVRTIFCDNSGAFWFGTSGGGISQFTSKLFTHYTTSAGLGGNFVYSIYRDHSGKLWTGTSQNGVSVLDETGFFQLNKANGFDAVKVKAIAEDKKGTLYFGTEGQGIGMLKSGTFSWVKGTKGAYVRQMITDSKGSVWVATSGDGLLKINQKNGRVESFRVKNGILQNRLTAVFIDSKGRIWYGTESGGVGIIDPKTKQRYYLTESEGLVSNAIRCITEDKLGHVWIGTAGAGVVELKFAGKPMIVSTLNSKSGLYSANVYLIVFDQKGNLFIGTESGLDMIQFSKQRKIKTIKHYAQGDGFLGVETCQNAVFKDKDGRVWFGTINGLTCYNPANLSINKIPPVLSITDIQLFYESMGKIGNLDLSYDQNHLSFLFKGINLRNPEGVKYSWKMKGFDGKWSPWSKEQRIVYSNVAPGKYVFMVRAKNEDGFISEKPLSVQISISAPFWKTVWFIAFEIIISLLLIWLIIRFQTRRVRLKAKEAQRQAELARDLVELEQKALRLQMNPHFIFNALNSIQGLIGTENETKARYYLAKFARLMRQILDNSRVSTISLEEEIATLENYLLIEQFCSGNKFTYEIRMDLETEMNFIRIPPMLIQPFIENAIKHGFKFEANQQDKTGKIEILFSETETGIRCLIRDNGIGRKAARKLTQNSTEAYHVSSGLSITQDRLDLLSESDETHRVQITDLLDENNQSSGTEVELFIPLL
jgi:ligand-binding sensor domain-containing protein/two-component sensor histidine kinase